MTERFSIGELGRRTGCKVVTIRYYEQIGLLDAPERGEGGHRVYERAHLDRLSFIRRARDLGFSHDDIRSLLTLSTGPAAGPCQAVDHVAAAHLDAVRAKISDLRRLELILVSVLDQCGRTTVEACCVLDALRAPSAEDGVRPAFVTTV
ncbi:MULTISPECIES: helix-turn-helix domain-containing protein [Brevundimonas]|uniref:MerR family transcriptional regulator n=1 Tax=Brevundimonas TaxID=41275 RepID=UPI000DB61063|nr:MULTISPECIES: helix-turn-helix domain-containing protein [Brevundimonas]PZU72512.1 MAG: MerR family transcriptional regulator [Brevundimonas sp.]HAF80329.1 MerR family transcriptional regulator [Brevundimonas sp.]HAL07696.1 MerR family transcriptional regulator [Brevundimonas sp.]